MATSEVQICNLALSKISEQSILVLTENSPAARACNLVYEPMRDAVIRSHPWNFATARVGLAQLASTPAFGFLYEYQLPADFLRVIQMEHEDTTFKIEGEKLLTDDVEANISYIKKVTDPTQFDALFVEALATRIGAELANVLSENTATANMLKVEYGIKLAEARQADAGEGTPEEITADTWRDARLTWSG